MPNTQAPIGNANIKCRGSGHSGTYDEYDIVIKFANSIHANQHAYKNVKVEKIDFLQIKGKNKTGSKIAFLKNENHNSYDILLISTDNG